MKTTLQKLTEKTLMLERNSELTICAVKDGLIIGFGNVEPDNFSFTPLAKLLSHEDIKLLASGGVRFGWTACTNLLLEKARKEIQGIVPEDFTEEVQHPAFTDKRIDEYQAEITKSEIEKEFNLD